ncbi:Phosphomevalonate kinase [Colletotrichum sp. SAR 10_99]|nr:Phosphomevalonate kinase [Colletotrichum sp. SAR 10_96]KAI8258172.1 Phosphomevalonate kinase [Colletotrichum sp. SAR 10_98]KAJ5010472.1 Phosphomevalonate kinase [Colletotrichum sp. SAR 10_99]
MTAGADTTATAVSAPGKVLLAGGYLVLDRAYTGLVFGLSARVNVVAAEIHTSPGVHLTEIIVESPQFLDATWRYGFHLAPEDGGITVTQLQVGSKINPNPFVETTLSYALTYIASINKRRPNHALTSTRLIILADNDYYSLPDTTPGAAAQQQGRFARYPHTLSEAHKTGLGSSAALVTSLTAALLTHHLPSNLFNLSSEAGKHTLHNLAQAAHCAAQGKVGSGFDVAAAVFGSCRYRRFSPSLLDGLGAPGQPGFAEALVRKVDEFQGWDVEVDKSVSLAPGLCLRMCDVDCGSQTVGMVKKVLAWRKEDAAGSKALWDELQGRNEALAAVLKDGRTEEVGAAVGKVRGLIRKMGEGSEVPIEPPSQTELLDAKAVTQPFKISSFSSGTPFSSPKVIMSTFLDDMDEATLQLVVQMQQEDIRELQDQSKGKTKETDRSDADVAFDTYEAELASFRTFAADRALSRRIAHQEGTYPRVTTITAPAEQQAVPDASNPITS